MAINPAETLSSDRESRHLQRGVEASRAQIQTWVAAGKLM